ncbi:MAG: hypothetical protein M3N29_03805 [Chloroflexota bacterium]|nr:hypothetical protein [Chloroflexota bacterium]
MNDRAGERLRVTVVGPAEVTVELGPGDAVVAAAERERAVVVPWPGKRADTCRAATDGAEVVVDGWRFEVAIEPARRAALREKATRVGQAHGGSSVTVLRAYIPGRVTRLWVGEGETVEQGQRLLAIEAMKMENDVRAPHAGRAESVRVAVGERVEREAELLTIVAGADGQ